MQIAQKIISTLLALQLLVSFGLCGGLCCLASGDASAAKVEIRKSEEPAAEVSHCPLHTGKAGGTKTQHLSLATASHQKVKASAALSKARSNSRSKTMRNSDCCLHRGSPPDAEPSQASTTLQSHKHFALLQPAPWRESLIDQSPLSSPPKPGLIWLQPHAGFQLSLRI